jgi:hypothetical protein
VIEAKPRVGGPTMAVPSSVMMHVRCMGMTFLIVKVLSRWGSGVLHARGSLRGNVGNLSVRIVLGAKRRLRREELRRPNPAFSPSPPARCRLGFRAASQEFAGILARN